MNQEDKDYNWLFDVILSCKNDFHFECVDKLISLFDIRHQNEELTLRLQRCRTQHWNLIHAILK